MPNGKWWPRAQHRVQRTAVCANRATRYSPAIPGAHFDLARDLRQPVYSNPLPHNQGATVLVQIPLTDVTRFDGVVMGEYALDGLLRFGVPSEVMARYAVTLVSEDGKLLAGTPPSASSRRPCPLYPAWRTTLSRKFLCHPWATACCCGHRGIEPPKTWWGAASCG